MDWKKKFLWFKCFFDPDFMQGWNRLVVLALFPLMRIKIAEGVDERLVRVAVPRLKVTRHLNELLDVLNDL